MSKGIAYGVGVGPGDPELMTLKAIRLIRENEIIFVPGKDPAASVAYQIALQAVPELADKTLVAVDMPMMKRSEALMQIHRDNARCMEAYLDQGKNIVYLTLGDPSIYCSFTYLQSILKEDGYPTELVSGITSFCAAAARLNTPLAEDNEPLHIIPASHLEEVLPHKHEAAMCQNEGISHQTGNFVLMKTGRHMERVKAQLAASGKNVMAVERCGMAGEKVYHSVDEIPDDAGYFSLIIAK